MFSWSSGLKIYLKLGNTDLRKSVSGLSIIVSEILEKDPFSGHLFVFSNRYRTIVKVLYWDRTGFCLWYKKLEKNRFRWPSTEGELLEIGSREFSWLLEGLDINQKGAHSSLNFKYNY